jgi:hypothetical protein
MKPTRLLVLLWLPLAWGVRAQAQEILPPPANRAQLKAFFEADDPVKNASARHAALDVLTGKRKDLPRDVVAREIAELAITGRRSTTRIDAVTILILAGTAKEADRYAGAFDQLATIYRRSSDVGARGEALFGISQLGQPQRALAFLSPIARDGNVAYRGAQIAAIGAIAKLATPESIGFLKTLHESGAVKETYAKELLKELATSGFRR